MEIFHPLNENDRSEKIMEQHEKGLKNASLFAERLKKQNKILSRRIECEKKTFFSSFIPENDVILRS